MTPAEKTNAEGEEKNLKAESARVRGTCGGWGIATIPPLRPANGAGLRSG
jgi:hypothetical protein